MKALASTIRDLLLHILPSPIVQFLVGSVDFVFVIHPRYAPDVCRKYPLLRLTPVWFIEWFSSHLWPVLGPSIHGIKNREGRQMKGRVVFCPLTAEQMFKDLDRARHRILRTVRLGEKLGPEVIGLGALSASVMRGKWEALDGVKALITSGSIFTSVLLRQGAESLTEKAGLKMKNCTVAVVGAAGLVGSLVSKLLAERVEKLILVDRRIKVLTALGEELAKRTTVPIELSKNLSLTHKPDIIVAATNAISAVLDPVDLPPGTLIIDDSRPTSTPLDLMEKRPDVIVVEGGVGQFSGMKCSFDFGLLREDEVFGCLGETILLCWDRMYERRHLEGKKDLELAFELEKLSKEIGFELAAFQWQGRAIHPSQFETVRAHRSVPTHQLSPINR